MGKLLVLCGRRFGRLLVLPDEPVIRSKTLHWHVLCDCGNRHLVAGASLRKGKTGSCGCVSREHSRQLGLASTTHGMTYSPTWRTWQSMIARCETPNMTGYPRYGGAGISVCERWHKFENFLADMGERPNGKTLDRWPNGKGNYEPGNCRWATGHEQAVNRKSTVMLTHEGRSMCMTDWSRATGISIYAISRRLRNGWDVARALTTPTAAYRKGAAPKGGK